MLFIFFVTVMFHYYTSRCSTSFGEYYFKFTLDITTIYKELKRTDREFYVNVWMDFGNFSLLSDHTTKSM